MQLYEDPKAFQQACLAARRDGELGLVPTMGFLHEGHEALMRAAARHRTAALTIFVNPSQFAPTDDLSRYPRDLPADLARAEQCGIQLVLAPRPEAIYPPAFETWVEPGRLGAELEGAHRPGHYRGVATVVLKLFQLAQPTHAYFGRKDYQQLAVIRRMTLDFDLPIEIVGIPTVRELDGLAKSSRNVYLSPDERVRALCLWRGIEAARAALAAGERDPARLEALALDEVRQGADSIDYVAVRDPDSLQPLARAEPGQTQILIAARLGRTRLIDNDRL